MRRTVLIGVMGPGEGATKADCEAAYRLGRFIGDRGWLLVSGGRDAGVMAAVNRGAREAGGLTIGVLPSVSREQAAESVLVPVVTGMGHARNQINVLTSDVVVGIGYRMGAGTASEIALALKAGKPVILLTPNPEVRRFFQGIGGARIRYVESPKQVETVMVELVGSLAPAGRVLKIKIE